MLRLKSPKLAANRRVGTQNRRNFYSNSILENISKLAPKMADLGVEPKLIELLLQHELNVIIENNKSYKNSTTSEIIETTEDRVNELKLLLNACSVLKNSAIMKHLTDYWV